MAALDMSDAFDPEFMDPLVCERNRQTVGVNGRAVDSVARVPFLGVVTNDTGDTLTRGTDSARVAAGINVTTSYQLRMDDAHHDADVVEWDGRRYTVTNVKGYGTYGSGFCIATCAALSPAG